MLDITQATYWFNNTRALTKEKANRIVLDQLIDATLYLPIGTSAPQRLWHLIHQTCIIPTCKTCESNVSWDKRYKQYKTYCGNPKCVNTDPVIVQQKRKNTDYDSAKIKRQCTNLERYGHTNYLAAASATVQRYVPTSEEYMSRREKREHTLNQEHGVSNISHTAHTPGVLSKLQDPKWLHDQHYVNGKSLTEIARDLGVVSGPTIITRYIREAGLETQTLPARSLGERDVAEFIKSLGVDVVEGDRTLIKPLELDIYVPSHSIAIEYCGLYWHSEQQGKTRSYHSKKFEACEKLGIQLITIFEDEWKHTPDIVRNKIASLISRDARPVVFARRCVIKEVSKQERDAFLNLHHIQGCGTGSVTHGLFNGEELVAVATWQQTASKTYVLNRYATSQRVVGGCSKLVKHFQRTVDWACLVSFADNRWSNGQMYFASGWKLDKSIPPDYFYSPDGRTRVHKFNYRRKNLQRLLKVFDPTLSEWENCKANNILRVWDCGKKRFVITK